MRKVRLLAKSTVVRSWVIRYTGAVSVFDNDEYDRWLAQARHTLASARRDLAGRDFDWACFKAQQAGEYAVKALLRGAGEPAHGHSLRRLLMALNVLGLTVPHGLQEASQMLDRHYIPARYPDAYPEGSPHEYYNEKSAKEALDAALEVIRWVQSAREAP
jgi:HEPN domain-containing protein